MNMGSAVLVTTEHRGVFFGYITNDLRLPDAITLTDAKCCIYWSADCKGFMGLASHGPTESCKISRAVPKVTFYGITSVTDVTEKAEQAWKDAKWPKQ